MDKSGQSAFVRIEFPQPKSSSSSANVHSRLRRGTMADPKTSRRDIQLEPPLTVTVREACRLLGVGNTTMWSLITNKRVDSLHIGRRCLVTYSSLEALLPKVPS